MATYHDQITAEQAELIRNAPLFFVASVAPDLSLGDHGQGPVNLSPKGGVPLHIIDDHRVAYLDYFGSGNETARHAQAGATPAARAPTTSPALPARPTANAGTQKNGPITIMVMSMGSEDAAIVRLFGHATATSVHESPLAELLLAQPAENLDLPTRQIIDVSVVSTTTSCGYGVPVLRFDAQRVKSQRGRKFKEPV